MSRRGRRPGDPDVTRTAILDAARSEFARHGYTGATIRGIARAADVDPALVHHHFGTKEDLFVAAHEFPFSPGRLVKAVMEPGEGSPGERLARAYLTVGLAEDSPIASLVRSATTTPAAAARLRELIEHTLLDVLEERLGGADARLRTALVASHLIGILLLRRVIGIEVLVDAGIDDLVAAVAPSLDRYLTGHVTGA